MSSLSTPSPAHDQHDPLLVAQLVAGDPLDDAQLAEARAWLAGCPACGNLATDLRALPAIVAQEPIPPRRRDFRLSPQQAEQLSGSAFTRTLRRLSLPRARAFAPAAGATMSIGLVLVVAGYAWPDGGSVTVEHGVPPAAVASVAPRVVDGTDAASSGSVAVEAFAAHSSPAMDVSAAEAADEAEGSAADRLAPRERSLETESLQQGMEADTAAAVEQPADAAAMTESAPETMAMAMVAGASPEPTAAKAGTDDALVQGGVEGADGVGSDAAATAPTATEGPDELASLLMLVGGALALAGGGLLLLSWLVRRTSDPLLR